MSVRCVRPTHVDEACRALADGGWGAKVVAGGTALMLMMKEGLVAPELLVSLDRIADPRPHTIERDGGQLRIGGLVSLTAVARSPEVRRHASVLAEACATVGNVRIRNVATLGGNLAEADYASDPPAVLVALGASAVVQGPTGRREVPVAELITGFYSTTLEAAEIITEVHVPVVAAGVAARYTKFRSRSSEDRPCVGVAARLQRDRTVVEHLSVVLGAVGPTPFVVPDAAALSHGTELGEDVIDGIARRAAGAIDPIEDHRGSSWYRRQVSGVLVRRTLRALRDGTQGAVA